MITPFKQQDEYQIDYEAVARLVEHLVKNGTDSLIVTGTTGESPTLKHEEELELFKAVKAKITELGTDTKIIFGAGSNCTRTAIESSKNAEALGADGLLIVTPYYNKPSQAGMITHFSRIAEATNLPVILYNIPGRCVINMKATTVIELARKYTNIVGLKEASNNIDQVTEIKAAVPDFQVYSGDDSLTLAMMSCGGDGVVSVASHLVGSEMKEMMNLFQAGDTKAAQKINKRLFPLYGALFVEPNPTCTKAALGIMNICSPRLRSPMVELQESQLAALKQTLEQTVPALSL